MFNLTNRLKQCPNVNISSSIYSNVNSLPVLLLLELLKSSTSSWVGDGDDVKS